MQYIHGNDLKKALMNNYRVYLCGNLSMPQALEHIHDDKVDVGTSYYCEFTPDKPHYHSCTTEYNYVISGASKVFLIDYVEEHLFEEGSLYVIPPMTKYASKHQGNTRIFFFRIPGGNDKEIVSISDMLKMWLKGWE